ncbi:hypothetical protein BIV57_05205 [Mangrovactinospora gilvigrisea]|uniref:Uncharacterized protein n=1 Tax=Mangrovactinospora gilvigrisea TaxID=1428644 RepID=A0A1J7BIX4_9ACTN|nr:hypothetical protein [Mangrovactinospora gilvigrisea]OIV38533.1 hypothetical protein BIV57_05205 [Mangrovactinospora gilvigrisea]
MSLYIASIEQHDDGQWRAMADGLVGAGDGYTAALEALTDTLFTRDGEDPTIRRDRTEVEIPCRDERHPDSLLSLIAAELPGEIEKRQATLADARARDAQHGGGQAVSAWCVQTAGILVIGRARPQHDRDEAAFIPWDKPDPRADDDVFLAGWYPHELDRLPGLKEVEDVPRTVGGILNALNPAERAQAWQEMTTATHGPALDRAMARWWHIAMLMGTAAIRQIAAQSTKRLEAGERGTPMTDLPFARALADLDRDLTVEEETAKNAEQSRQQMEDQAAHRAREEAYRADLERLLGAEQDLRDAHLAHQRRRQTVNAARAGIRPALEYPLDVERFAVLAGGRPITLYLPARPWRHAAGSEAFHFVFTSELGAQLARVTTARTYASLEEFAQASEPVDAATTLAPTRQELESYPARWGGIIALTAAPVGTVRVHT